MSEKFKTFDYKLTPILEGRNNYEIWSERLLARLEAEEDLDDVKYRDYLKDSKDKVADYKAENDKRVKWLIKNSLNNLYSLETKEISECFPLWTTIRNKIHPATQLTFSDIRENIFNIKFNTSAEEYISSIRSQVDTLKMLGKPMEADEHFHYLRRGLPPRFDNLRMAIRNKVMSPEEFSDLIKEEELAQRVRNTNPPQSATEANIAQSNAKRYRNKNKKNKQQKLNRETKVLKCKYCPDHTNHTTEQCNKYCKNCKMKNHWTKDCRKQKQQKEEANMAETSEMMFNCDSSKGDSEEWTLDSGATNHIFNNKNHLHALIPQTFTITVGNGDTITSTHVGNAKLVGTDVVLTGCLYAPQAIRNLISVHQLLKMGFALQLSDEGGRISKNGIQIPIVKQDRLFVLQQKVSCLMAHSKNKLIHRRLGHLGSQSLSYLLNPTNNQLADYDFPKEEIDCVPCAIANLKVRKFGKREDTRTQTVLELVYTDVCGPFNPTIHGERYYITFTDDFTRYLKIFLLQTKDQSFSMFTRYKSYAENLHKTKILKIHSDQGGEFINKNWTDFCNKEGVQISFSPRKTPQLNGVAESANRVINWKIRTILQDSGLPQAYWGYAAIVCALYKNLSPTEKKEFTPFYYWFNRKPTLKALRVFGCLVYFKQPDKPKLEAQTERGILLGFDEDLCNYTVMNLKTRRIIYTRECKFDENTYPQLDGTTASEEIDYQDEYIPKAAKSSVQHGFIPSSNVQRQESTEATNLPTPIELPPVNNNSFVNQQNKTPNHPKTPVAQTKTPGNPNTPKNSTQTPSRNPLTPINFPGTSAKPVKSTMHPSETTEQLTNTNVSNEVPILNEISTTSKPDTKKSEYKIFKEISEGKGNLTKRTRKQNPKFALFTMDDEPISYNEALKSNDSDKWMIAMQQELSVLMKNETWNLVVKPLEAKPIRCKWVYKLKRDENGLPFRYKARLVAVGSSQREGIDYDEISSPVVRWETIRLILSHAINHDLPISQSDVESAYLYGKIDRDIYMHQPPGFTINDSLVCKLNKSLYGLKQSGKIWNSELTDAICQEQYIQTTSDPCLFFKQPNNYVLVYVDDIIIVGKDESLITRLSSKYNIRTTTNPKFLLNVKLDITSNSFQMSQPAYIQAILQRFQMADCKPSTNPSEDISNHHDDSGLCSNPYREAIGALIYLSTITRPDISYIVNYLARRMETPTKFNWKCVQKVFRYLKHTPDLGINLSRNNNILKGTSDADFANDPSGRSTSGTLVQIGENPIIWKSKLQTTTALSTMEAEYYALTELIKNILWIKNIAEETSLQLQYPIPIFVDNQSTIKFVDNTYKFHARSKHINTKFNFIKESIENGTININYIPTNLNNADILTKALKGTKFISNACRIMNN